MPEFAGFVKAVRLPVSFEKTPVAIRAAIRQYSPEAVLMLGFSAKREKISVERVAINIKDAKIPDNDAVRPVDEPISTTGPAAIFSTLPVKGMLKSIHNAGIDAIISNSAGTYVCNETLYSALKYSKHCASRPQVGFIHLPSIQDCEAVKAVEAAVEYLLKWKE